MTQGAAAPEVLPYGDRAVMVDLDDVEMALAWAAALRDPALPGVADVVPGMRSVLVIGDGSVDRDTLVRLVTERGVEAAAAHGRSRDTAEDPGGAELAIPVRYDGPDLADVAALTGLSESEVVQAHTGTPWRVAFAGFAPGFGYLTGGDTRLVVPRRSEARPHVATGSVGLAGEFSGVYPRSSPGGWQVIGHTDVVLWDVERDPPALLTPGVVVRFVAEEDPR